MKTNWNWRGLLPGIAALAALVAGLSVLPAAPALAHEDSDPAPGEWRVPGGDIPNPGDDRGNGGGGGLNADPDTFEIDSWTRGDVRPVDAPDDAPADAPASGGLDGFWTRILAWLVGLLADAGQIPVHNGR